MKSLINSSFSFVFVFPKSLKPAQCDLKRGKNLLQNPKHIVKIDIYFVKDGYKKEFFLLLKHFKCCYVKIKSTVKEILVLFRKNHFICDSLFELFNNQSNGESKKGRNTRTTEFEN